MPEIPWDFYLWRAGQASFKALWEMRDVPLEEVVRVLNYSDAWNIFQNTQQKPNTPKTK